MREPDLTPFLNQYPRARRILILLLSLTLAIIVATVAMPGAFADAFVAFLRVATICALAGGLSLVAAKDFVIVVFGIGWLVCGFLSGIGALTSAFSS